MAAKLSPVTLLSSRPGFCPSSGSNCIVLNYRIYPLDLIVKKKDTQWISHVTHALAISPQLQYKDSMAESGLTDKQKFFCLEYVKDFNGTQAAIRAGYSRKGARQQAVQLLSNPNVQYYLEMTKREREAAVKLDAQFVLGELGKIYHTQVTDILDDEWKLRPLSEWPMICRIVLTPKEISEIFERNEEGQKELIGYLKKINWPDKLKTLEMIGKHTEVKAFIDTSQLDVRFDAGQIKTLRDIVKGAKHKEVKSGSSS